MSNTILSIQVIPKVLDPDDHYPAVEAAIAVIEASGVNYEVGAVGTTMEGDLDQLLGIVKDMQLALVDRGSPSIISQIRLFHTTEGATMGSLTGKFRQ